MGEWRFYAQRPGTGKWLDTNVQLADPTMTWALSGPNSGQALIPAGLTSAVADDGQNMWGKMNTILFGEEDGYLSWCGICTAANPDKDGLHLEFIGPSGWLQGIPFYDEISVWRTNVFDVVRTLINHSKRYRPGFDFVVPSGDSAYSVGDAAPPGRPKEPPRKKGETTSEWHASARWKAWQKESQDWDNKYRDLKKFEIGWYEAPYVGEEIDTLAKEAPFEYRERVVWADKGNLIPRYYFDFADLLTNRRTDIAFQDGVNLAAPLDPKDGDEKFANMVIGLGAGEGRTMIRSTVGETDGRLYQAQYVQYKSIRDAKRLRSLITSDFKILNNKDPKLDALVVWDVPGFADVSTLRVGDEVRVTSENVSPTIDAWVKINQISRNPYASVVNLAVEVTT